MHRNLGMMLNTIFNAKNPFFGAKNSLKIQKIFKKNPEKS